MPIEDKMRSIENAIAKRAGVLIAFSGEWIAQFCCAGIQGSREPGNCRHGRFKDARSRELLCAKEVAKEIGIAHKIITYDELGEPGFIDNPVDRCYYCKKGLIRELKNLPQNIE